MARSGERDLADECRLYIVQFLVYDGRTSVAVETSRRLPVDSNSTDDANYNLPPPPTITH